MKKYILLAVFIHSFTIVSAQWGGSSTTTGLTHRTGNVLIGATSIVGSYDPTTPVLQVQGSGSSVFGLRATSTSAMFDMFLGSTWLTLNAVNVPMGFSTNYVSRMRITTTGEIGIGTNLTNNPNGYKLAVNGKIGAKEVQVENTSSTWADYVFESDYKLLALEELERYVKANKHLPEIPSKKDVEAYGHKLGEMDVLLLKKIEEITLYLIELKNENEQLKRDILELKNR